MEAVLFEHKHRFPSQLFCILSHLKKKEGGRKCRMPVDKAYSGFCYSPNWGESQNVMQCGLGVFPSKESPLTQESVGPQMPSPAVGTHGTRGKLVNVSQMSVHTCLELLPVSLVLLHLMVS